jgi:hypothetical protein
MIKRSVLGILRFFGYELCRLNSVEKGELPDGAFFNYKEVEIYRALSMSSQISIEEAMFLGKLVRRSDPSLPIIEIGTLFGFSTMILAVFKSRTQHLITIDDYSWNPLGISANAHYLATQNRLSEAIAHHNVAALRIGKDAFYATYSGPRPGLFFCDADHSYEATKADLLWAKSVGAEIICGDDYDPHNHQGVTRAVDELGGPRELADALFVL